MGIRARIFGPSHRGVDERGLFGSRKPVRSHRAAKGYKPPVQRGGKHRSARGQHRALTLFGRDFSRRQPPQAWNLFDANGLYRGAWQGAQHSRTRTSAPRRGMFGDAT